MIFRWKNEIKVSDKTEKISLKSDEYGKRSFRR